MVRTVVRVKLRNPPPYQLPRLNQASICQGKVTINYIPNQDKKDEEYLP